MSQGRRTKGWKERETRDKEGKLEEGKEGRKEGDGVEKRARLCEKEKQEKGIGDEEEKREQGRKERM